MNQIHLINTILNWERRLEIENEKRKAQRSEPYREHQTLCRKAQSFPILDFETREKPAIR